MITDIMVVVAVENKSRAAFGNCTIDSLAACSLKAFLSIAESIASQFGKLQRRKLKAILNIRQHELIKI